MKRKAKKLIVAAVLLGGVSLLVCGGVIGVVASGVLPGIWSWTKQNAGAIVALHPDAAEFVESLQTLQVIDPGLRTALNAMGQATMEPEALLAQLAAAAVPASALDGLSPAEMNTQLAAWGLPLRVVEPVPAPATTSRDATDQAENEQIENEQAESDASEPDVP